MITARGMPGRRRLGRFPASEAAGCGLWNEGSRVGGGPSAPQDPCQRPPGPGRARNRRKSVFMAQEPSRCRGPQRSSTPTPAAYQTVSVAPKWPCGGLEPEFAAPHLSPIPPPAFVPQRLGRSKIRTIKNERKKKKKKNERRRLPSWLSG